MRSSSHPQRAFRNRIGLALLPLLVLGACGPGSGGGGGGGPYDLVVSGGRVLDPATELDAVRHLGIRGGSVEAVSETPLEGADTLDATGLVVAPGFVDLHAHGQTPENYRLQALDGVTSALEMEVGTEDVAGWYAEREGTALINYGVSAGHARARMEVMDDPGAFVPVADAASRAATPEEVEAIVQGVEEGLAQGGVGVGFGLQYTPVASRWEILETYRAAARHGASTHVHLRHMGLADPEGAVAALAEVLAASAVTGAPLHVVHIHSSGLGATSRLLTMVEEARARGLDVTTEAYPYTAGSTGLESAIFDEGWQEVMGATYGDIEWVATGERLTEATFREYRAQGGFVVIHFIPEEAMEAAITAPFVMIASDGRLNDGRGHPRSSGTYAKVLDDFVGEAGSVELMDAIRKMSLLPAQRLEGRVPGMARKGRIGPGADADIVVFDLEAVQDHATYQEPALASEGFRFVLVNGVPVVRDGALVTGVVPGRAIRAPVEGGG